MFFQTEITWIGISIVYIACAIGAVILSKYLKDFLTPYRLDEQLTDKDNPALGLATTGYFIGVMIIFLGATVGPSPYDFPADETLETAATETASGTLEIPPLGDLAAELGIDLAWAIGGMLLLNLSCLIVDKLVLYRFSTRKEIIEDRNAGTGAVEAGCLIASALVIAGSIHGEGGLDTALVFFGLGQLVLVLFGVFYQFINSYDIHKEIEEDNVAAGVSLGLNMVAIGVILLKATFGDFINWSDNLLLFGLYSLTGFLTLLMMRKLVDLTLFPKSTLTREIAGDRNLNAAYIEGSMAVGSAAAILLIF